MPEKSKKRITMRDRVTIEDSLRAGENLNAIAKKIGKTWPAVAREIKTYRSTDTRKHKTQLDRNLCVRQNECEIRELCGLRCSKRCAACNSQNCNLICEDYTPTGVCSKLEKAPYVCNDCQHRLGYGCEYEYVFYEARTADDEARWRNITARRGINITEKELKEMVATIKPLLKKGQSLEHIWQTHHKEFPVSVRTFYRWINLGVLEIINLHLPKQVKYKKRKKKDEVPFVTDLVGKTYVDFLRLAAEDQISAIEMDCVCGRKGQDPAILTLMFRRYNFQIMVLLQAKTQEGVARAIDQMEMLCGKSDFKSHFKHILTDRGFEFLNHKLLEKSIDGGKRCSVYYCDPMKSNQKAACERNHVEIRKILPKGTSFEDLTAIELAHVCSHVNSYKRPALGGFSPYELASRILPMDLIEGLGIEYVAPDDVILKPSLFKELGLR